MNSLFDDLGSILDPQMTPKSSNLTFSYSSVPLTLKTLLTPKGSPNASKTAQRVRFYMFGYHFSFNFELFSNIFLKNFHEILDPESTAKVNDFVTSFGTVAACRVKRSGYIHFTIVFVVRHSFLFSEAYISF